MAKTNTSVRKHSVLIAGHRTSVSLEDAFWLALKRAAEDEAKSLNTLITEIDATREGGSDGNGGNLSSALRVYILNLLEKRAG